ncbi:hypothetical protein V8C44DRAFT_368716 [Trichoderma aethiopicum]
MLSILPWALVALPLTEARFGIRPRAQNNETAQCCPCVSSSLSPQATTVTVTVTSPKETVTIDHTVVQQATTVFVTHTVAAGSPSAATHEATANAEPLAKIETVFNAVSSSGTSTNIEPIKTITKTVQPGDGQLGEATESPKTVTVTVKQDEPTSAEAASTATVTTSLGTPVFSTPLPNAAVLSSSNHDQGTGASTVTVTVGSAPEASQSTESGPIINTVAFLPTPSSPETATSVETPASPTAATMTSAGKPANSTSEPVAVEKGPASPSTATVTLARNPSKPGAETVTFVENPANQGSSATATAAAAATSGSNLSNSAAKTVTFAENIPQSSSPALTRTSPNPSVQTVDFVPNTPNPTITTPSAAQPATTTPPQLETMVPVTDRFTTLTQTMTSGGNVTVEVIIVNIFTGETICRKEGSDEPCDDSTHETHLLKPSGEVSCLTTGIFTKTATATAFNTVVVTVSPGLWSNGTLATGVAPPAGAATGTGSPMLRRGRVPMVRRRL